MTPSGDISPLFSNKILQEVAIPIIIAKAFHIAALVQGPRMQEHVVNAQCLPSVGLQASDTHCSHQGQPNTDTTLLEEAHRKP